MGRKKATLDEKKRDRDFELYKSIRTLERFTNVDRNKIAKIMGKFDVSSKNIQAQTDVKSWFLPEALDVIYRVKFGILSLDDGKEDALDVRQKTEKLKLEEIKLKIQEKKEILINPEVVLQKTSDEYSNIKKLLLAMPDYFKMRISQHTTPPKLKAGMSKYIKDRVLPAMRMEGVLEPKIKKRKKALEDPENQQSLMEEP